MRRDPPEAYAARIAREFDVDLVVEVMEKPQYGQELYFIRMWSASIGGEKVGGLYAHDEINVFLDGVVVGLARRT